MPPGPTGTGSPHYGPPRPEERYGIKARLQVYLVGSKDVKPEHGLAGWVAAHTGELEHEVELLSPREFLSKTEEFLTAIEITEILSVSFDGNHAYQRDGQGGLTAEILSDVISSTMTQLVNSQRRIVQISLVAHGKTHDFELQLTLEFRAIHAPSGPSISLDVWAFPRELWSHEGELRFEHADRVNNLISDEQYSKRLEAECRVKMESLLENYQSNLRQQFDVRDVTRELKIDISSTYV